MYIKKLSCENDLLYVNNNQGDINQDSLVNVLDVISLINFILGFQIPSELESSYSDLNSDNLINILDVVMLVNLILD